MEAIDTLQNYALAISISTGFFAAILTWWLNRRKVDVEAATSVSEQQRLNMESLLKQNRELANDLGKLRSSMARMHEDMYKLTAEINAMRSWYQMRVALCSDCPRTLIDDAQRLFAKQETKDDSGIDPSDK